MTRNRLTPLRLATAGAIGLALSLTSISGASQPRVSTPNVSFSVTHAPTPAKGATDEYRCTWYDPHFSVDQMVTQTEFLPAVGSTSSAYHEVHHAIAYIADPSMVAQVKALDPTGTKGWSCFSSPLGATSLAGLAALPWLAGWAPGHGVDVMQAGYGERVPAGSLIVLQIHYNSLAGKKTVASTFNVTSQAQSGSSLTALHSIQYVAAPDMPCVAPFNDVKKYPLCDHAKSLDDLGKRFGAAAKSFTQGLEYICNHNQFPTLATDPMARTATCTWKFDSTTPVTIHGVAPHMHMLGKTFNMVLCHQDATCANVNDTSLALVPSYNFDNQFGIAVSPGLTLTKGDYVKITCTYDPTLRKLNPQTKNLPPRYITWGDGSSDEMCLGTLLVSYGAGS